ncbi:MAG: sialate O-acetylesterase [Bacteroidota bacterium]|nr:sialate O-acetylesterase [Bacteroidota bacterium]
MKRIIRWVVLVIGNLILGKALLAEVRLPAIISNHMVLQQHSQVNIWGWCEPGEKISLRTSWDTVSYHTTGNSSAKFSLKIQTPAAGGPYRIFIHGQNDITLDDVLIGEVWLCSGQSNMEMSYSWGIKRYTADIEQANQTRIRLFHIPKLTAAWPQDNTQGYWVVCNPEDMKTFSLAGYFFGKKLQEVLSCPVGLIEASWGGTPAEVWTPGDLVTRDPALHKAADSLQVSEYWPSGPGLTFNAMIHPLTGYKIAGAIWYQGESNTGTASTYHRLFSTMIRAWRQRWGSEFPFYFVQIAPFSGYSGITGALLQEAQTQTLSLPHTGMVVISDLVDDVTNIHPRDKKDVGYRLADLALTETYHKEGFPSEYPSYQGMKIENSRIRVTLGGTSGGLVCKGPEVTGFYLAGKDRKFYPAEARIDGSTLWVSSPRVADPVAVRYDFTNTAIPNLFGGDGLPVNGFRTDDWDGILTP